MSQNHSTPPSTPRQKCLIYGPSLALLALGKLDEAQASEIRAHLADCAYCQRRLREYTIVREAAARHLRARASTTSDTSPPGFGVRAVAMAKSRPITLEDIMQNIDQPPVESAQSASPVLSPTPRQRRLSALLALVAVLILAILATSLFRYLGSRKPTNVAVPAPNVKPTPIPTWASAAPQSTLKGTITEFHVPTKGANPNYIIAGPDGNLWFTESHANKIGRSTAQGNIVEFDVPTADAGLTAISSGPDGNLWFTERDADKIGRITPQGVITEYAVPSPAAQPLYITAGHDGNIWFTEAAANSIGKITPQGVFSEYAVPTAHAGLSGITTGVDGNVWFVEYNPTIIGRITPQGVIKEFDASYHLPSQISTASGTTFPVALPHQPVLLAPAADGVWWNFAWDGFGYMQPNGRVKVEYSPDMHPEKPSACFEANGNVWSAPDGAIWIWAGCDLERLTLTYNGYSTYGTPAYQLFPAPPALDTYSGLVLAPMADGTVWFVGQSADEIGRLT